MHEDKRLAARELRVKGEGEQSSLAIRKHAACDVEERRWQQHASLHDANPSRPLGDEEPRIAGRRLQIDRTGEAGSATEDLLQPYFEGRQINAHAAAVPARGGQKQAESDRQRMPYSHGKIPTKRPGPSDASPRSARARRARSLPPEPTRFFRRHI